MNGQRPNVRETAESRESADREALARMANGDALALAELYDRHARAVYSLAYRIVAQDAEDVTQEVFSQAWRHAKRYEQNRAPVGAWLLMMTRARAIDRFRARRVQVVAERPTDDALLAELPGPGPSQETEAISAEEAARVREALAGLPDTQRAAIELAFYGGLTHAEIAEQLGEPLGTVKTRVRSGLMKLRTVLGQSSDW
jgi:RNA polymerase sigma-70 factor (ECF subfamily)